VWGSLPDCVPARRDSTGLLGPVLGLLLLLLSATHGAATPLAADLDPQRLIPQGAVELRGWSRFVAVTALAHDPEGDVWLGTSRGVLRFDGARLESLPLWSGPDPTVADLAFAQGRLHVLTRRGALLEWSGAAWIPRAEGPFRELGTDPVGNLLVAGGRTLLRLDHDQGVLDVHPALRGRSGWAMDLKLRQGRTWLLWGPDLDALKVVSVGSDDAMQVEAGFDFAPDPTQLRRFEVSDDGSRALWAGGLRLRTATGAVHALPNGAAVGDDRREWVNRMLFTTDGALLVCGAAGLLRWSAPEVIEVETAAMPHPLCLDLVEEDGGAVWAGSYNGPARFSRGLVWQRWLNPGDPKHGQAQMLTPAGQDFWVAARNGLHRFAADGRRLEFRERPGGFMAVAQTLDGQLYASAGSALYVWRDTGWLRVALTDDGAVIRSLQADPDGALWVLRTESLERLARVSDGIDPGTASMRRVAALPVRTPSMLAVTRDGRRLLAADALYELGSEGAGWRLFELARPLRPTVVLRSLFEDSDGDLWIATLGEGLWRWREGRLQRFGSAQGLPGDRYAWVAVAGQGDDAVVYAAPRVADYVDDVGLIAFPRRMAESATVPWRQLGRREGLIGAPVYNDSAPAVQVDRSGQIWIAAAEGLAVLRHQPWSVWSAIERPRVTIWQAGTRVDHAAERASLRRDVPTRLEVRLPDLPDSRLTLWYRLGEGDWQVSSLPTRVELGVLSPGVNRVELQARRAEGLRSPPLSLALDIPRSLDELPVVRVALGLTVLTALTAAAVLLQQRWRERWDRELELSRRLDQLSRFQRLVLACVVQGRTDDERIVKEIGALMEALDLDAWVQRTLLTLRGLGFLIEQADGEWQVAESTLRRLSLGRESLESQLRVGGTVGRYLPLERIGEGGHAVVHRAKGPTGKVCALKLLRGTALTDGELRERLRREAAVLASLEHPGVVRLYDHGPYGADDYFLALELIPGVSLATALRHGPYAEAPARQLLQRLREALCAIHAIGIIHRDLKPENLMLRSVTDPVLIDFGLARNLARDTELTEIGRFIGTLQYVAPEQCMLDPGVIGPAADWWAFGVLAHELLLGYQPWNLVGLNEQQQRLVLFHPDGASRRAYPPDFPAPWRALIDSCLERDPRRRRPDFSVLDRPSSTSIECGA